jgi:hypothetical protein
MVGAVVLAGCGNGLTTDFVKSGRYAFALVKSAEAHQSVGAMEVTRAFAQAEADAKSDADKKTLKLLNDYLQAYKTNSGTAAAENYVKACHKSLDQVFDENVAPETAAQGCSQALTAVVNEIVKETNEKDKEPAQKSQPK